MSTGRKGLFFSSAFGAILFFCIASTASAQTPWQNSDPCATGSSWSGPLPDADASRDHDWKDGLGRSNCLPNVAIPEERIYFGAYVNPEIAVTPSPSQAEAYTEQLENEIGRPLATHMHYLDWDKITTPILSADESIQGDLNYHRIPVLSWRCGDNLTTIASGADDALIDSAAASIRSLHIPVFLRFFWEFDLLARGMVSNGDSPTCFTANETVQQQGAEFNKAWKHLRARFLKAGAWNVSWVWNPTGQYDKLDFSLFYPGSDEVDWIGVDHYDLDNAGFTATISGFYSWVRGQGYEAPILIAETGELNDNPDQPQELYLTDAMNQLQVLFPQIRGFMWFDADPNPPLDWIFDKEGLSAFATMGKMPYFQAGVH